MRKIYIIRGLPIFGHDTEELQLSFFQNVTLIIANNWAVDVADIQVLYISGEKKKTANC